MLDTAINQIVVKNGRYWPAALESIKNTFMYDSKGLNETAKNALSSWLELLNPIEADLSEKLKIIVIHPPWEHHKGEDGHFVDVAAENSKVLATEVAGDMELLFPLIGMLLQGEQRQSNSFGRQLALELHDIKKLLDVSLQQLLVVEPANPNFILGIYQGIFEKSPKVWQECIDMLLADSGLVFYYPDFIRTGDIQESHLDVLLGLIRKGVVSANSANILSYGSVTKSIYPKTIAKFCLSLAELGEKATWPALNVIYMYCHGNNGSIEIIREPLKTLVTAAPLPHDRNETATDVFQWHDMAKKLLRVRDEEFAIALVDQLISACQHGFNHSDIWHYTKPLLLELMRDYSDVVWPIFGESIVKARGTKLYWLQQLLDRENSFSNQVPSVLSVLPVHIVITWCKEHPDLGPNFVANCVNIFETAEDQKKPAELFVALLENFGDDERVKSTLISNMHSRGWSGSLVPYLETEKAALSLLMEHQSVNVRGWVTERISQMDKEIKGESSRDDEKILGIY